MRFQLAFVRMVIDDRPLPDCWNEHAHDHGRPRLGLHRPHHGRRFAFGIASNVASRGRRRQRAGLIGVVVYVVLLAGQYLWTALFTTAAMRRLSTAEPAAEADAVTPA